MAAFIVLMGSAIAKRATEEREWQESFSVWRSVLQEPQCRRGAAWFSGGFGLEEWRDGACSIAFQVAEHLKL